ncbi:hypothetical protein V1507DRAFT_464868 [Lipomyces tetrasporus]
MSNSSGHSFHPGANAAQALLRDQWFVCASPLGPGGKTVFTLKKMVFVCLTLSHAGYAWCRVMRNFMRRTRRTQYACILSCTPVLCVMIMLILAVPLYM